MHEEFNAKAQGNYEKLAAAPKRIEQKLQEEKELAEIKRDQLVRAYADRLSLNQKRVLLGIQKFVPRAGQGAESPRIPIGRLAEALSERVRDLRKKGGE